MQNIFISNNKSYNLLDYSTFKKYYPYSKITRCQYSTLIMKIKNIKQRCKNCFLKENHKDFKVYKNVKFDPRFFGSNQNKAFCINYFYDFLDYHLPNSSINRIDSSKGYFIGNIENISELENSVFNKEYLTKAKISYYADINLFLTFNQRSLYQGLRKKTINNNIYQAKKQGKDTYLMYHKYTSDLKYFKAKCNHSLYQKLKIISAKNKELIENHTLSLFARFPGNESVFNVD